MQIEVGEELLKVAKHEVLKALQECDHKSHRATNRDAVCALLNIILVAKAQNVVVTQSQLTYSRVEPKLMSHYAAFIQELRDPSLPHSKADIKKKLAPRVSLNVKFLVEHGFIRRRRHGKTLALEPEGTARRLLEVLENSTVDGAIRRTFYHGLAWLIWSDDLILLGKTLEDRARVEKSLTKKAALQSMAIAAYKGCEWAQGDEEVLIIARKERSAAEGRLLALSQEKGLAPFSFSWDMSGGGILTVGSSSGVQRKVSMEDCRIESLWGGL